MNKLIAPIVCLCAYVGVAWANLPQPSDDPVAVNAIKKLEQDMGDAMVHVDLSTLGHIYADDFATVTSSGKIFTKQDLLRDFESSHDKLLWFEIGSLQVQVYGDVAMVHGSSTEKRLRDGKDVSGEFVWMDLLEKRGGQWMVVRSAGSRVK